MNTQCQALALHANLQKTLAAIVGHCDKNPAPDLSLIEQWQVSAGELTHDWMLIRAEVEAGEWFHSPEVEAYFERPLTGDF